MSSTNSLFLYWGLTSSGMAGSLDRFGNCIGTNYKSNRGERENVILQAKFKIYLSEGAAIANSEDNTLIPPLGTKMKLSDNYGVDTFKGETVWTNNHYNCEEQDFVVLFDGPVSLAIPTITKLIQYVYPDIQNISSKSLKWFQERTILSPTNEQVDKLNDLILSRFDAQSQMYYSVDTVLEKENAAHFPTEFLNSLTPSGVPPHIH
ncbi:hypothetical protein QTP88_028059 [Uroleucon formosanum]